MRRTLVAGAVLALFAFLLVDHGAHFGVHAIYMSVLGAALGAAVGLVPDRLPLYRAGAFLIGFVISFIGYVLRVQFLPDAPIGHALAAAIVVAIVTVVAALSFNRLPLWSALLGVAALVGAYEQQFTQNTTAFKTESLTAAATVLLASAIGFLGTAIVAEVFGEGSAEARTKAIPAPRPAASDSGISLVTKTESEASR